MRMGCAPQHSAQGLHPSALRAWARTRRARTMRHSAARMGPCGLAQHAHGLRAPVLPVWACAVGTRAMHHSAASMGPHGQRSTRKGCVLQCCAHGPAWPNVARLGSHSPASHAWAVRANAAHLDSGSVAWCSLPRTFFFSFSNLFHEILVFRDFCDFILSKITNSRI